MYEYAQSDAYPIRAVLAVATMATSRDASKLPELLTAMDDPHPVVRYWAATGCLVLKDKAAPAKRKLLALLDDPAADVRVVAAEALSHLGEIERATQALSDVLDTGNEYEVLAAITVLELFARSKLLPAERVRELVKEKPPGVAGRVFDWIQSLE